MGEQDSPDKAQAQKGSIQETEARIHDLEEYKIIQASRDCIRKAKAHMVLNLMRDTKGNKRASARISSAKGR